MSPKPKTDSGLPLGGHPACKLLLALQLDLIFQIVAGQTLQMRQNYLATTCPKKVNKLSGLWDIHRHLLSPLPTGPDNQEELAVEPVLLQPLSQHDIPFEAHQAKDDLGDDAGHAIMLNMHTQRAWKRQTIPQPFCPFFQKLKRHNLCKFSGGNCFS